MNQGLLQKSDGSFGVKIGGRICFTREAAEERYRRFCATFAQLPSPEGAIACSQVADDMFRIGFSWDEIEVIEISAY